MIADPYCGPFQNYQSERVLHDFNRFFFYLCRDGLHNPCFTNRYITGYLQRLSTEL